MWKRLRGRQGVLLIEVLMTITILSVGLVMIVQALLSVSRANHLNGDYVQAAHMARNILSDLQLLGPKATFKPETGFEQFEIKKRSSTTLITTTGKNPVKKTAAELVAGSKTTDKLPTREDFIVDVLWKSGNVQKKLSFVTFVTPSNPEATDPEDQPPGAVKPKAIPKGPAP